MNRRKDLFSALYPEAPAGIWFAVGTETSPALKFPDVHVAEWRQYCLVEGFALFKVFNINHYVIDHSLFSVFVSQIETAQRSR